MGKAPNHKQTNRIAKKKEITVSCNRQFPDCPPEQNDTDCKLCPLYIKK